MQRSFMVAGQQRKTIMKKIILPVCMAIITAFTVSCTKQNSEQTNNPLDGIWELSEKTESLAGTQNYPAGNGNKLIFNENKYQLYANNVLIEESTYTIKDDTSVAVVTGLTIPAGEFTKRIEFNAVSSPSIIFFHITGEKLVLLSGHFPTDAGIKKIYRRINNN
jgi:thioredoxin-related protein